VKKRFQTLLLSNSNLYRYTVALGVPSLNIGAILAEREDVTPGKYDVTFDGDNTDRTDFTDFTDASALGSSTYRAGDSTNR
jgi:hypothetical protein